MRLVIFDVDGTLIESYYFRKGVAKTLENYALVKVLEGRRERIEALAVHDHRFALATNQAGVALGYQTERDVYLKMGRVAGELECFYGAPWSLHVCMHHPEAKDARWALPAPIFRRKPEPGLLLEAMEAHGAVREYTCFVGAMESDAEAAKRAGVSYVQADEFFAPYPF
jgi:D-glycero-D-manno-heptose 1,7-bisphosphate phosphatase